MIEVLYPEPQFRYKDEGGKRYIFDGLRRQWLLLTPEEWVRQNFLQYLQQVLNYPAALIALEKEIRLNELRKRFDILVYDAAHQPWLIVECKAPEVPLAPHVLEQALRYNISVPVPYLVITNGAHTMGWIKQDDKLVSLSSLPPWPGSAGR
ncbi:MAG: type I restriction enzyme HsdR N-terminal domain-containing protein [Sphingobacteriales bacterium]|nr:MAG: type I restriction enzyme HsdR N-terminal domain-containing protein [Sphingobacteriales bacterium]